MRRRLLLVGGLAMLVVGAGAGSALACSCAYAKPRDRLAAADAAFIGTVVKKTLVASRPRRADSVYRYRVRVRRSFKRTLTRRIRVTANTNDGTCGFEWERGDRVAAYLYGRSGPWRVGLCSLERPRALRRAAAGKESRPSAACPRKGARSTAATRLG